MRAALTESRIVLASAWLLAAGVLACAILRTFGLERGFLTVVLVAWTPLAIPVAMLGAALALLARRPAPAIVAAAASALLVAAVLPRAVGSGHDPGGVEGPELRVMTANLTFGTASAERTVELVREQGIELLCVQELTPGAARELRDAGLDELLPHFAGAVLPRARGTGIYSVHRLRSQGSLQPVGHAFEMPVALTLRGGTPAVEIACAHPAPPTSSGAVEVWREALRALPPAPDRGPPRVLVGDFNATLDHLELRRLLDTGYVDAGAATGRGLTPTWPAGLARPPVTIDRVLVDERAAILDYGVHDLEDSDHRAVSAVLRLPAVAQG